MKYKNFLDPHNYSTWNNDRPCCICHKIGGYQISSEYFCDECVATEKAFKYLNNNNDDCLDWDIVNQPPIPKWQEWNWPECCDDQMVYHCDLSKEKIRNYCRNQEPDEFIKQWKPRCNDGMDYYRSLRNVDNATKPGMYDLMLHLFKCDKCQKWYIQFDAS
jgi:hypothetical protein